MRRGAAAIALLPLAAIAFVLWRYAPYPPRPAAPSPPFPPGRDGASSLALPGGVPLLRLVGTPREQGLAHGRLLRDAIRAWVTRVCPDEQGVADFAIATCGERLLPFVPEELREEMGGIAEGAGVGLLEVFHLNSRFDLAPFGQGRAGGAARRMLGPAAAQAGAVVRVLADGDVDGLAEELLVVARPDGSALVCLPGMVGCFLGLHHGAAAALRPMDVGAGASLNGLSWPILLRVLLAAPPEAGRPLPAPVTLPASLPFGRAEGPAGTLNVAPGGAALYPALAGMADATEEEAAVAPGGVERVLRAPAEAGARHLAASSLLRGRIEEHALAVRLDVAAGGVEVTLRRHGATLAALLPRE